MGSIVGQQKSTQGETEFNKAERHTNGFKRGFKETTNRIFASAGTFVHAHIDSTDWFDLDIDK